MSEKIVEVTGADYFEIIPTEPYSESDLNYSDDGCRANREQQDETARPSISDNIENIEQYESDIPSGGEWNPVSWIPLWKVTIFPVRRWRTSVHQEEAESIQAQRI